MLSMQKAHIRPKASFYLLVGVQELNSSIFHWLQYSTERKEKYRLSTIETNTPVLLQGSLGIPVPIQPWFREMGIWALCHIWISEHPIHSSLLPHWTQSQGVGETAINSIIRQLTRNRRNAWRLFQSAACECHDRFHSHLLNLNLIPALKPLRVVTAEQACWALLGRILSSVEQRPTIWYSYEFMGLYVLNMCWTETQGKERGKSL